MRIHGISGSPVAGAVRACLLATAALAASQAIAQSADEGLSEVVVTAERRTTDLQETALSITAIGEETISEMGVSNVRELAEFVSNLSIMPSQYGDAAPQVTIRGVGGGQALQSFGAAGERNIAMYVDGLYYPRTFGSIMGVTEIESVEVLKGPQGTLFGRNTTGGAINYTSKKARLGTLNGFAELEAGNHGRLNYKGAINLPLGEQWALLLQGADLNYDGYVKRGDQHLNNSLTTAGSLQLHGEPTDNLTVDFRYTRSDFHTNGTPSNFVQLTWNENVAPPTDITRGLRGHLGALSKYLQLTGQGRLQQNDPRIILGRGHVPAYCLLDDNDPLTMGEMCETFNDTKMDVVNLKLGYDVNDHIQLSSLTGGIHTDVETRTDSYYTGGYARDFSQGSRSFQQEFQLNLNYEKWHAVTGLVYFKEEATEYELTTERLMTGNADPTPIPPSVTPRAVSDVDVLRTRRLENYSYGTDSYAAYGQASYSFTKWLELTGGLRYSDDKKDGKIVYTPTPPADLRDRIATGEKSWSSTDYKASLQVRPKDDLMFYVSQSKAFKAGIINDGAAELAGPNVNHNMPLQFANPEEVTAFEVGMRSEWLDRKLRVNLTYFDQDWKNRHTSGTQNVDLGPPTGVILVFTTVNDPGIINMKGFEADIAYKIFGGLTFTGSYGRTEAESSADPDFVLDSVPKYNYVAGLRYSKGLFGGSLDTSVNYSYRASSFSFSTADPDPNDTSFNSGYGLWNANISYRPDSGRWSLSLYGRNLADKEYNFGSFAIDGYGAPSFGGSGAVNVIPNVQFNGQPRTYGATFRYNFGVK